MAKQQKLVVDQDKCIGCGTCVALAPEVFELNDEGKAIVRLKAQGLRLEVKVKEAIEGCPVGAIGWRNAE